MSAGSGWTWDFSVTSGTSTSLKSVTSFGASAAYGSLASCSSLTCGSVNFGASSTGLDSSAFYGSTGFCASPPSYGSLETSAGFYASPTSLGTSRTSADSWIIISLVSIWSLSPSTRTSLTWSGLTGSFWESDIVMSLAVLLIFLTSSSAKSTEALLLPLAFKD